MEERVSGRFLKSIKENKNKKGILAVIKVKLEVFQDTFDLSKQKMIDTDYWVVKKIDATSVYGAYRIIVAQNKNNGNLVYDFYFKNKKDDLDKEEIEDIRSFLEDCKDEEYFDSLQKLSDIQ